MIKQASPNNRTTGLSIDILLGYSKSESVCRGTTAHVGGPERLPNFPHTPTLQEAGYPDVIYILWTGVFAPAKTPAHVTRILRDAIRPFMQDKAVIERFMKAGSQVSYLDGAEFAQFLGADTDRLLKVVRQIGLS